ncbi:MAG: hypothetical protein LBT44_09225, partial [Clostridiales bacterium]|nr:hypothetical protein [Clostridiales bacterium]
MKLDAVSNQVYVVAINEARLQNHEYITPEHFLYAALMFDVGKELIQVSGGDLRGITEALHDFFENKMPRHPGELAGDSPSDSYAFTLMLELALARIHGQKKDFVA